MDFSQIFTDPRNAFAAIMALFLGWLHINHGRKLKDLDVADQELGTGKVDRVIYKKDQELLKSQLENKIDRVEFHLRLLCEKSGIHYQEKR